MKILRVIGVVFTSLLLVVMTAIPVFAYLYRATLTILEGNGTTYTMLPLLVASNNSFMAANGFMEADALDTRVETLGLTAYPHSVSDNATLTVLPVPANSQTNLLFSTGNADLTSLEIIIGYGGSISVADNAVIELGDLFIVEVEGGWVDSEAGSRDILGKANAFSISSVGNVGAATANVTATVDPAGANISVTASNVTVAEHDIRVEAELTNLIIYIDDVQQGTTLLGGASVPDNANNWAIMADNVMPYCNTIRWYIR